MNLGNTITEYRKARQLSQQELADKIGVSRSAIAKWENDNGMPDIENIQLLANEFQMTVDHLLSADNLCNTKKEVTEQTDRKLLEQYQNKICNIELTDWNDGVWEVIIQGEDNFFLLYKRKEKRENIVGAIAKRFISNISVEESSEKVNAYKKDTWITKDYFKGRATDIYLEDKHIWSGIFGEDTERMGVCIAEITNEYVELETEKCKIDIAQIVKMECLEQTKSCPCKRLKCERHGNCEACKEHHRTEKKYGTACERIQQKRR